MEEKCIVSSSLYPVSLRPPAHMHTYFKGQ